MEKKEDEEGKVKKFPFSKPKEVIFPCSKPKEVVLESEIRFFLGKKEEDPWLLREEDEWLLFCRIVFFGGERTKVGGLNLRMAGNFSWAINSCFLILSDLTCSYRLNYTSWAES